MKLIQRKLQKGMSVQKIASDHFDCWCRYYKAFEQYRLLTTPGRDQTVTPTVVICFGPTGTGKSKWAIDNCPEAYWKPKGNWWCGYTNQKSVVFDEFYGWLPYDLLLRICDRYPLEVETKGGAIQLVATTFVFTTNKHPEKWYKDVYYEAFKRRITLIKVFNTLTDVRDVIDYKSLAWEINF